MSSCFAQLANALVPRACKSHPWSWLNKTHCSFQPDTGSSKWQEGGKQALSHGHYRWVQANRRPQFTTCQEHVAWGQGSLPRCTPLAVPRAPARLLAEVPACSWIFSCPQSLSTLPHLFSGHRWRKIALNHVPFIEYIVFPSVIYSKCHNCHFKKYSFSEDHIFTLVTFTLSITCSNTTLRFKSNVFYYYNRSLNQCLANSDSSLTCLNTQREDLFL